MYAFAGRTNAVSRTRKLKFNNQVALLHIVLKEVLSEFKENKKLVTFEPQEQFDMKSTV